VHGGSNRSPVQSCRGVQRSRGCFYRDALTRDYPSPPHARTRGRSTRLPTRPAPACTMGTHALVLSPGSVDRPATADFSARRPAALLSTSSSIAPSAYPARFASPLLTTPTTATATAAVEQSVPPLPSSLSLSTCGRLAELVAPYRSGSCAPSPQVVLALCDVRTCTRT